MWKNTPSVFLEYRGLNNKEYPETNLHFNGTVFWKIEWEIIFRPRMNFYFSVIFNNKLLSACIENTLNGEKNIKILYISANNRTTLDKL